MDPEETNERQSLTDLRDKDAVSGDQDGVVEVVPGPSQKARVLPQLTTTIVSSLAGLILGFTFGYSSPAIPDLKDQGRLDKEQATWFGSIVTLGAVVGAPLGAVVVEKLGRKGTLIAVNVPYGLGWLFIIFAEFLEGWKILPMLYTGRLLCGVGVGISAGAQPIYIAEVTTKNLRGLFGTSLQLTINIGIMLMFAMGLGLYYRWLAVIGASVCVLMVVLMFFMPETPRHLVNKGKNAEALKALRWLRGPHYDVNTELEEIQNNIKSQPSEPFHAREFLTPEVYHPLIIAVGLMIFQDASGINAVLFYANDIMERAGFEGKGGVASVVIGIILVLTVFPATALTDRVGRKVLLIISQLFMVISLVTFGLYFYLTKEKNIENLNWLSMTSLIIYIAAFSLGMGPIAYVVVGEIFPMRARGIATSVTVCIHWIVAFVITKTFELVVGAFKSYGAFWFYAGMALVGLIFTILVVPETKGKSLEEIEASFLSVKTKKKREDEKKESLKEEEVDPSETTAFSSKTEHA